MKENDVVASLGKIVRIRNGQGEWEGVLKRRSSDNGDWEVTGPDGKIVAVTAQQIIGVKGAKEQAEQDEPKPPVMESDKLPNESWGLAALATFITLAVRRTAETAWWIGKALCIAHGQHTETRDWLGWLRDVEGLSKSAAYRYMDLCKSFTIEEVQGKSLSALYKLMQPKDEPEEPASDSDNIEEEDGTDADSADQQKPAIAGKLHKGASSAANEQDTDGQADNSQEPADEPQPLITDAELDALTAFIEAVGGVARAEYVFCRGIEQIQELDDDES